MSTIVGRHAERSRLNRLIADLKNGYSGSLTLRGEAGIGKTALLDYLSQTADGVRVCRVVGIEAETELPFAALQLLFAPFADRFDRLPDTQAQALRGAIGAGSTASERHLVGAATLTLLSELAAEKPMLCIFDDVHWMDQSTVDALIFAVRRLTSDPIATVFALRDGVRPFSAPGDELTLHRLGPDDSARLLAAARNLPTEVARRIVTESSGNPLAIIEFADEAADADPLAIAVAPLPAVGRLEDHYRRKLRPLPASCRIALLLAAANQGSELRGFLVAASALQVSAADLTVAEQEGLVRVTPEAVEFRHPLIRTAAYQDAPFADRVRAHRALASALSDPRDADRRAWHLAAAAEGTDENAAAELDLAAHRAAHRGAPAAAARALERAAQLSGAEDSRGRRLVLAARATYDAGQLDRAFDLAAAGAAITQQPGEAAEAAWVQAQVAYERDSPAAASELALAAAGNVLTADPDRAIAALFEATWCARDAADADLLDRCASMLRLVDDRASLLVPALVGFTELLRGNIESAVDPVRSLMLAAEGARADTPFDPMVAGFTGILIGEDALALRLLEDNVATFRSQGALGWLPYVLEPLALAQLVAGRFRDAESSVSEAMSLAADLGQDMQAVVLSAIQCWLTAVRGDGAASRSLAEAVLGDSRNHAMSAAHANWALAMIDLTEGRTDLALDRLDSVCGGIAGRDVAIRAIPDQVEAAVRSGDLDRARLHLPRLADWATSTKSPVGRALVLRCEALLADGSAAQELFEASLGIQESGPYDRARTQLAYAEWLRRHRRPAAAKARLTTALDTFERIGARLWLSRVRAELLALGEGAITRTESSDGISSLTPQELQVVRLAALGLTNPEIASRLFLSPRTVGHHLYKAYPKLRVSRRAELSRLDL